MKLIPKNNHSIEASLSAVERRHLAVCLLLLTSACGFDARGADPSPNLLLIQTDEHNFRTLGCYRDTLPPDQAYMWGKAVVQTPNIDWIAHQGALCTSFYATTPVCSPSRAALVSGRYPQHTPVVSNNIPLDDNVVTFAEILRRRGYATGYAGKWHLDGIGKPQWAPRRKFGFEDNRYMFNRGHWKQLEDTPRGPRVATQNAKRQPNYAIEGATPKNFTTDFLTNKTLEFLRTNEEQPFCYWVSFPDPHGPDRVRAPYDTMFNHQTHEKPRTFDKSTHHLPTWAEPNDVGYDQANYYGMVKCLDDNIGRILNGLRQLNIIDHTIIVFTSDHGDLRGEHRRHNKGVPYEGSAKIPFLVHYPGKIKATTIINQALTCVDFMPTILSLMNVPNPVAVDGRDASSLFLSEQSTRDWVDIAFVRSTGWNRGWMAAITDRYKFVVSDQDEPWLFDLEQDPDELTNFAKQAEYHAITRHLARSLHNYGSKFQDPLTEDSHIQTTLKRTMNQQQN